MVGKRDQNLRSGDLSENLGIQLLRMVALVAPIPRTEDVGIDAFCTLFRARSAREIIAEESFIVQIKSSSTRVVKYQTPDEIAWLANLKIPFFIARIDYANAAISLYATHRIHQVLCEGIDYKEVHLYLDSVQEQSSPHDVRYANLGSPILSWSLPHAYNKDFAEQAYSVLKSHISVKYRNIRVHRLRILEQLKWQTNELPQPNGIMIGGSSIEENPAIMEAMVAPVQALISDIFTKQRYSDLAIVLSLIDFMRKYGVDPDPQGTLVQVALLMADGDELDEKDIVYLRSLALPGQLDLSRTRITDSALQHIPNCTVILDLSNTKISDAGLQQLTRLTELARLSISGTSVTDEGIQVLRSLCKLNRINIQDTQITDDGINSLKQVLPEINIIR